MITFEYEAQVVDHGRGLFEMWCDEHSIVADPATGFAPQATLTSNREWAQRRVDLHNEKWHPKHATK